METQAEVGDVSGEITALRAEGWSRDGIHEHLVAERGLSYFQAEEAVDGNGTYTGTARAPGEEAEDFPGIGGWLVIPTFWIIIHPLLRVAALKDAWALRDTWSDLSQPLQRLIVVEAVGNVVLIVLAIWTATLLFRLKRQTPALATIWLVSTAVLALIVQLGLSGAVDREPDWRAIARAVVFAVVWTAYFLTSRRVKNTFVR